MRKIVRKDGYCLFFDMNDEGQVRCTAYESGSHLNGEEIASALGISRSAVSQILKRTVRSIYYKLRRCNTRDVSALQIVAVMAEMFGIKTDNEYKKFFKLFPESIQGDVYADARKKGYKVAIMY